MNSNKLALSARVTPISIGGQQRKFQSTHHAGFGSRR